MAIEMITVKLKSGPVDIEQFTDIPSAIEFFTVRDENGHIRTDGETIFLQLVNCRQQYNRKRESRNSRLPLSRKRLDNLIKENPEFHARLDALLVEFGQPPLRR